MTFGTIGGWIILTIGIVARMIGWFIYRSQGTAESLIKSLRLLNIAEVALVIAIALWVWEGYRYRKNKYIIEASETVTGQDLAVPEVTNEKTSNGYKHIAYGVVLALLAILGPLWIDFRSARASEDQFHEAQRYLQTGDRATAIQILTEVTEKPFLPGISATAYLMLGVLYRYEHFDVAKALEHCNVGLRIDPTVLEPDYLNRDSNGNTIADLCRIVLEEKEKEIKISPINDITKARALILGENYTNCKPADVIGLWTVDHWMVQPGFLDNDEDPLASKYQYFFFTKEGKFRWINSNLPIEEKMLAIFIKTPPPSSTYSLADGKMTLKQESDPYPQVGSCGIFSKSQEIAPGQSVKKGDMLHIFYLNKDLIYLRTLGKSVPI